MPTAVLTEAERKQVAHDLLGYLRRLGDVRPERAELLAAGVSSRRVDALYPFEFDEVAPVLTYLIQVSGLRHLKKLQVGSFYGDVAQSALTQPHLFGINGVQQAQLREVFNNRAAEGTEKQQRLFDVLRSSMPNRDWRNRSPALMHSLWLSCWMMANQPRLGVGVFSKVIESNFMETMELLLPDIDLALDCLVAERQRVAPITLASRLRALIGKA